MDLATRRTTILSALYSIAASVYIIRGEKLKREGAGRGACLEIAEYPKIDRVVLMTIN